MTSKRALLCLAALVVAACGGGDAAATPREALDALRGVLVAGDGAGFYKMLDSESQSRGRAEVRERRAMLRRGDDPAAVVVGLPLTAEELTRGDESDTVRLFFPRRSPLFRDAPWIAAAKIVDERQDGADAALIDLRGENGVSRRLWFAREGGTWKFDSLRTRKEWVN
jgi:hypothetical protein